MFDFRKSNGIKINLTEEQEKQLSDKETIEKALRDESVVAFDIHNAGELIGFAMLKDCGEGFFLWDYAIDVKHQNKDYGSKALNELIEFLKSEHNISWITTTYKFGNEHARRLYEKLGFVETDIVKTESIHEVNMILKLR
ncbi:MAG: GNAT family N-acetyltransferase [Clostridia bacterium]|nr:GNAT family N-acetyltransferase [Clostridia bacterium]